MRRRTLPKSEEKNDRWIVSYADLLTLLFCFFVVMYSISSLDASKYSTLSETLEDQLGSLVAENQAAENQTAKNSDQAPLDLDKRFSQTLLDKAEREIDQIAKDVELEFGQLIDEQRVQVKRNKFWLEVEFKSNLLYPSGSSQLLNDARPILVSLAQRLAPMNNRLNIEGFTDNIPISNELFPSNWELSAARAATVVRLFESNGVAPNRMASIGYGEHQPVADNSTDQGRAMNRRVVVVVMASVGQDPESADRPVIYQFDQFEDRFSADFSGNYGPNDLKTQPLGFQMGSAKYRF